MTLILVTTGCWDMVEINQRLFPYSIGVDLNEGEGARYVITISYPNINAIGKNATQKDRVYIVSTIASSVFEGIRQLYTRLPYELYFKHLRVVVLGKNLIEDEKAIREIMDGMNRDFIINKKVRLVVAEDKAKDLLLFVPEAKRQEVIDGTIFTMLRESKDTSRYTPKTITDFISDTDISNVTIVPRAIPNEDDIKFFGGAVFKDYSFIGNIGEIDNRGILLMKGKVKKALIDAPFEDVSISYQITASKLKREIIKDGNLKIKLKIETEGTLEEYIQKEKVEANNLKKLEEMEKAIEKAIKDEVNNILEILQKKYKADAIGIGEHISKFHPKLWKEVSKDWDQIFSEADIEIEVDAKIRRRGLIQ